MRSRNRKKNSYKWLFAILAALGIYLTMPYWQKLKGFDAQDLVTNSILGKNKFEAKVQELESPKYKIKAYVMADKENPIVSVSFLFKNAGYASDSADEEGIANMVAALLADGAGDYSSDSLKEELESKAIKVSFGADKDDFSGQMLTTKANLDTAAKLTNLMLTKPHFAEEDIARVKKQMLNALRKQQENPNQILSLEFNQELFGSHPYARNPLGEAKDILAISQEKLQQFVQNELTQKNLLVGIAGDVSVDEAGVLVDKMFADLSKSGKTAFVRPAELQFDGRHKRIEKESGQNISSLAAKGVARNHEDFYPLYVANYVFGGAGLTSRLSQKIREEQGLTYGVYTYMVMDDKAPLIMAGFSSTKDKYAQAKELLLQQWKLFAEKGLSRKELEKAKNYLTASNNLRFASIENIAAMLVMMQKYQLGLDFLQKRNDYISQIELDEVNKVIKKYFSTPLVSAEIGSF